jgi:hypothetical protein
MKQGRNKLSNGSRAGFAPRPICTFETENEKQRLTPRSALQAMRASERNSDDDVCLFTETLPTTPNPIHYDPLRLLIASEASPSPLKARQEKHKSPFGYGLVLLAPASGSTCDSGIQDAPFNTVNPSGRRREPGSNRPSPAHCLRETGTQLSLATSGPEINHEKHEITRKRQMFLKSKS